MNRWWRSGATLAANLGLPAVLRQVRRRQPGRAFILMYHRIAAEEDPFGLSVRPDFFDRQLALLRRRMPVLRLSELVVRLRDAEPLREDIAAITFDDGYRDNLDTALPILQRHGCAATIFVTTGFVERRCEPIGERLGAIFRSAWERNLTTAAWERQRDPADAAIRASLAQRGNRRSLQMLVAQLKALEADDLEQRLRALEQIAGTTQAPRQLMLDWHGVRTWHAAGMEIASHTVTHPILARTSPDNAEQELRESKRSLEVAVGAPVDGFAYPNGGVADFTPEHAHMLSRLGYAYACSAIRGVNRPGSDPFRLRRIGISNDTPALFDLKLALGGPVQPCAAS